MKKQPEYTYERDNGVWSVFRWREGNNGMRIAEKVYSCLQRENARKEAYKLNGWMDIRLEFTHNWNNKLQCKSFTTIRLWNERKYVEGKELPVYLHGFDRGFARIISVKKIKIEQINEHIARLDTGYSARECKELIRTMYKNKNIDWEKQYLAYCLLQFVEEKKTLFDK